jgi:AraC family transcriptional regulator
LRNFSGARVRRVVDRSHARIPEHAHDWPLLSLVVLGGCSNETELGENSVAGPSAILFQAGAAHRNVIGPQGFEQIEIEFDPAWLGFIPDVPVSRWLNGRAGAEVRSLLRLCGTETSEEQFRAALRRFIERADIAPERDPPDWVAEIARRLHADATLQVNELAKTVGRHPSWLGTAYRRATGEGLQETAARFRVERAARLLRETDQPYAAVAADAGFCDQSHMNRTFRRMLDRLPSDVRNDRAAFRKIA